VVLSDREILDRIERRGVDPMISPFIQENLQPASVDLTLDCNFLTPGRRYGQIIDFNDVQGTAGPDTYTTTADADEMIMHPKMFALGSTVEAISVPDDLVACIHGK
jgi:dCTP deaminase